ncbi:CdaR family transcriptional regulator [Shouchella miscanthi]|uniref:CdaR family transcriptional regulator n=1 Tax=Shouchella miscanthi TaxID=2598861 RepID=UPI001643B938|nr:sugar diacid recognition domain-containing protein [Shouchella miscanthi]
MTMLTKEIANAIVQETSIRLDRNINIMDKDGYIIASRDAARLHTVHGGAVEVLNTGNSLTIYPTQANRWEGAIPGINLPILFNKDMIGVIGITGNPDELKAVGELVKMTTELMIQQAFITSQLEWKQRTKEMVIDQLLNHSPSYKTIQQGLEMLDVQLLPPFIAVAIQLHQLTIQKQELIDKIEQLFGHHHAIAGFISLNQLVIVVSNMDEDHAVKQMTSLQSLLQNRQTTFTISYSLSFEELNQFHQAYSDCELALTMTDKANAIISFSQFEIKALLHQINHALRERFSSRVLNDLNDTQTLTLKTFFENDLNIQKTADALFLHRNTLLYRLNTIVNRTGYNPKTFNESLILQVALWMKELEQTT